METQTGLSLVLGQAAFTAGATAAVAGIAEADVDEDVEFGYPDKVMDFEVHGTAPGGSALVIVPLLHPLPADAVYRKFANGAWQDFVIDAANAVYSAPGSGGACPSPGHAGYVAGLNASHGCVQLRLQDGGSNDTDGNADGVT